MKLSLTVILIALSVTAIVSGRLSSAYVISPTPDQERVAKRSLCNTFGGCGAKRSMQQLAYNNGRQHDGSDASGPMTDGKNGPWPSVTRREPKLELITEILNDLIDYLKTSEKYKQGRYIVMVPTPTDQVQAPGRIQLSALDVQELQQSGRYSDVNKDE